MHTKRGYILFLLFTILSVCSVLISLYFSKVIVYRQLMHMLITKEKANRLAITSTSLIQALLTPDQKKEEAATKNSKASAEEKTLSSLFAYWNKFVNYKLTDKDDGCDVDIKLSLAYEQGKLNLNSFFDFEKKKFINEGQANDRKKLCVWLFDKIAAITKKPSLFPAFEKHITNRNLDFNDVTELLAIKEFSETFGSQLFISFESPSENTAAKDITFEPTKICLTDIFTVSTEQDTINPWLFSHSWCKILDLKPKTTLSDEEKQKIFSKISKDQKWETDWNSCLKDLYQKEYKDLAQEIKTILTTQFEANIFSLLLKVNIGETNSTIFTIVKSKANKNLISFEVLKSYQI